MNPIIVTDDLAAPGLRVVRGPNWIWGDQDGGLWSIGTILSKSCDAQGWVNVVWDKDPGVIYGYRVGGEGRKYDLAVYSPFAAPAKELNKTSGSMVDYLGQKVQQIREQMPTISKSEIKPNNNGNGNTNATNTSPGIKVRRPISTIKGAKRRGSQKARRGRG